MKKWWMKGLAVALCAGMLAPAAAVSMPGMGMTVYATNSGAGTSGTEDSKKNENTTAPTEDKITSASLLKAVNSLKAQKISLQPNEEQAKKLDEKLNEAYGMLGYKDGTCNVSECKYSSQEEVDAYVNVVKSQMNDIVNPPKDDSDDKDDDKDKDTTPVNADHFLMVGGTWVTPVANAGQEVSIVLPVVNMGKTNVTNAGLHRY